MADDQKVYYPETIQDSPMPNQDLVTSLDTSQETAGEVYGSKTIKQQPLPTKRIAIEVIGNALNTKSRKILAEFEFTQTGAIQVGSYQNGVSGDIKISPNGIVARDQTGATTFAIDGTTGDAVFKGTVQTGTLISGQVIVGNNNVIIDGENQRIIINDGQYDRVILGLF
jgi:hypothetical protein